MRLVRRLALVLVLVLSLLPACLDAAEAKPVAFDPTAEAPYFADGPAAAAAAHLRLEDWSQAASGFAAYLKAHPKAKDAKQSTFLLGYAELKAGRFNEAAAHFDGLVKSYPLLAEYERIFAARAHLQAGRATQALDRAKRIPPASALDGEARFLRGEAERLNGHHAAAAAEYRSYARGLSAGLARQRGALPARRGARYHRRPRRRARRVAQALPRRAARIVGSESGAAPRHGAHLHRRRAGAPRDGALRCHAERRERGRVEAGARRPRPRRQARLRRAAFTRRRACSSSASAGAPRRCSTPPPRPARTPRTTTSTVKALYQGGRSWGQQGRQGSDARRARRRRCSSRCGASTRSTATPTTRASARPRSATRSRTRPRPTSCSSGLPLALPAGDQKGEALWRLAFRAWRKGDVDGAQALLAAGAGSCCRAKTAGGRRAARSTGSARVADKQGDAVGARRSAMRVRRASIRSPTTRCRRSIGCARSCARARRRERARRRAGQRAAGAATREPAGASPPRAAVRRARLPARRRAGAPRARRRGQARARRWPASRCRRSGRSSRPTPSTRSSCGWRRCSTIAPASTRCRTSSRATS